MTEDICQNRHRGDANSVEAGKRNRHCKAKQQKWVLDMARKAGPRGVTVDELAELASESVGRSVGSNQISGRVTELVKDGKLSRMQWKRKTRTGTPAWVHVVREPVPTTLFDVSRIR